MIPKIIHYVWLGKEEPEEVKKNIATWREHNPDYEIKRWDESNFNLNEFKFARQSYDAKKYSFTSDVIRVWALYNYGGIYLDSDILCFKPFDELLQEKLVLGFESTYYFSATAMLCEKGCTVMKKLLQKYREREFFIKRKGRDWQNDVSISILLTETFFKENKLRYLKNGNYEINGAKILEMHYLSPPFWTKDKKPEDCIIKGKTFTLHLFEGSWKKDIMVTGAQKFLLRARRYCVFRFAKLHGNIRLLWLEQNMYDKWHEYTEKNLRKNKKNLIKWI